MISSAQMGFLIFKKIVTSKVLWLQVLKVTWKVCVKKFFQEV